MDNKDIIIRQAAEIFELKDALSKSEYSSKLWFDSYTELKVENERLEAIAAQQVEPNE